MSAKDTVVGTLHPEMFNLGILQSVAYVYEGDVDMKEILDWEKLSEEDKLRMERIQREFADCRIKPDCELLPWEEIFVTMSDGIRLRTFIRRPDASGAVPVIFVRSCYPENAPAYLALACTYAERGIAFVWQYCRGTGGSEGEWQPYVNERADGKDAIEWLCAQDWVESVGCYGSSYVSLTGWAIADLVPEKVRTMYLSHYGNSRFMSAYQHGLFHHDILTAWTMKNAGFPITADYHESCLYRPQISVDEDLWGQKIEWYREYLESFDADAEYWKQGIWNDMVQIPARVNIPICLVEAWYDHHLSSALVSWMSLPEETRKKSRLVIGAWNHIFEMCLQDREISNAHVNDDLRAFEWFYRILVEKKEPVAGVERYLIGADSWFGAEELESRNSGNVRLYLSSDGRLQTLDDAEHGTVKYIYDPAEPFISHGGESLLYTFESIGSLQQEEPDTRDDTITFMSEPMKEDLDVSGKIRIHLTVSTNVDDTAFICRLIETMPDGRSYNVRIGATTLGYRNDSPKRIPYTPGETVEIMIECWDIAYRFGKGSCIRLDITSSDFPQYSVHSNYAGPWAEQKKCRTAEQIIHCGGSSGWIELPLPGEMKEI